jgi:hypothetical protein
VNSCHTDVVDPINRVSEVLEDDRGLLGNRQIGSAGRHYSHGQFHRFGIRPRFEDPAGRVVAKLVEVFEQRSRALLLEAGHQHLAVRIEAPFHDTSELFVCLAWCEDRLGHAGTPFTVGVEACEAEILDSLSSQAIDSLVDTELTGGDSFQHLLNFFSVQRSSIGVHAR